MRIFSAQEIPGIATFTPVTQYSPGRPNSPGLNGLGGVVETATQFVKDNPIPVAIAFALLFLR